MLATTATAGGATALLAWVGVRRTSCKLDDLRVSNRWYFWSDTISTTHGIDLIIDGYHYHVGVEIGGS